MKQSILYEYLGTNGTIRSGVYLEGIYSVKKIALTADVDKKLTKDNEHFYFSTVIPENELSEWKEVPAKDN